MRYDINNLWLIYESPRTGERKTLPALDWVGQPGPIDEWGDEMIVVGWEDTQNGA